MYCLIDILIQEGVLYIYIHVFQTPVMADQSLDK